MKYLSIPDLPNWPLTLFFIVALVPFSLYINNQGVSANYLYFSLPLLFLMSGEKLRLPPRIYIQFMALYAAIFCVATIYQYDLISNFDRRAASFVIFMGIFALMFINITPKMVSSFKIAIISISVYFSIYGIFTYISEGAELLGYSAKDVVGSQRFGFVYLIALWILILFKPLSRFLNLLRLIVAGTLFLGLLLTFSRSSIVALVGGFAIYYLIVSFERWRNGYFPVSLNLIKFALLFSAFMAILFYFFPVPFEFMAERLFSNTTKAGDPVYDFENPIASEGYRVWILKQILTFVAQNPFTGSGYLGVWVAIDEGGQGSAHNQYTDVLFRTGIFGFYIYLYMLTKLGRYLLKNDKGLFFGYVSVLIYGLFHETFKESQGAFLLAFLFGMMGNSKFDSRRSNRSNS